MTSGRSPLSPTRSRSRRASSERVAELGPGEFFGEMGLLEKDRRNATVVAKTPMRLITLTGWDLRRMEKAMPQAVDQIRQTLEQRRPGG